VVVSALSKHSFRRYLCLNLYMLFSFLVSLGRYQVLSHFGLRSSEYKYFYFYSDAVLTIFLYLALITLYLHVFDEMKVDKYLRLTALLLLIGTALFSYGVVQQSSNRMLTGFFFELSQNLYFVGLVLTYVLWGAILKLRETRTQLIQLVLSLGVYFSAFAATFALENMFPNLHSLGSIIPVFGCLLPLAWAYAFWRLTPDARMSTARLAVVPR
jgi:membrane-associated HD superfamily phosphohydrolase